ncbi:MAG: DNA translocase FtsK [Thermoguttaceae bacterium]
MKQIGLFCFGIAFFVLSAFLAFSIACYTPSDYVTGTSFSLSEPVQNRAGHLGAHSASFLLTFFGHTSWLLVLFLVFEGITLLRGIQLSQIVIRSCGFFLFCLGIAGFFSLFSIPITFLKHAESGQGGFFGSQLIFFLEKYFDFWGVVLVLATFCLAGLVLFIDVFLANTIYFLSSKRPKKTSISNDKKPELRPTFSSHSNQQNLLTNPDLQQNRAAFSSSSPSRPVLQIPQNRKPQDRITHGSRPEISRDVSLQSNSTPVYESQKTQELHSDSIQNDSTQNDSIQNDSIQNGGISHETNESAESGMLSWFGFRSKKQSRMEKQQERSGGAEASPNSESFQEETEENLNNYVEYSYPPLDILTPAEPFDMDSYQETVLRQSAMLEKSFSDFGLQIKVVDIQTGPVIAQFEIQLAKGLRLNKIMALSDDLAIALKVPSVRIVAPIPGKNTVGVELPNEKRQTVRLRDVMEHSPDAKDKMAIPVYLGKDVTGKPMIMDLTKLPHLLIAGRTGTGKSVCLNSIIVSMLMTRGPDEVRMLMIDPKMVELSPYKTIPHLMHPVVTDMKKAEAILGWAVEKMEERYQLLAAAGVRQLSEYNKLSHHDLRRRLKMLDCPEEEWNAVPKKMPYLVIVADEMADLMMTSAKEVETHIIRLAQKSRAVGIHLVLATQKPTVDIITGLIKSNLPARIAFGVATRSDSQVVLDRNGAERLLGNGDMLFLQPGTGQAIRGQGTYLSDAEIESIIELVGTEEQDFVEELVALNPDEDDEISIASQLKSAGKNGRESKESDDKILRDEIYYKAVEYIIQEGRGSLSLLQRRFSIGYGRAARMIDFMAEDGVVGSYNGSQAREVLMTLSDWKRKIRTQIAAAQSESSLASSSGRTSELSLHSTSELESDADEWYEDEGEDKDENEKYDDEYDNEYDDEYDANDERN